MFFQGFNAKRRGQAGSARWRGRLPQWGPERLGPSDSGPPPSPTVWEGEAAVTGAAGGLSEAPAAPVQPGADDRLAAADDPRSWIGTASLAFRGYDVANLGRTPELLAHRAYGPVVRRVLGETSVVASDALGRRVDLAARAERGDASSLATFAEDVAFIVGVELAQVALLDEVFGVKVREARQSFGYSIGELASLVTGGTFALDGLLPVPLRCADDCAELADGATLAVVFSRGPALSLPRVQEICTEISGEGRGLIGVSAYLAPNTLLAFGQGETLARLESAVASLPGRVMVRRKPQKLPPLHTPLVWQRNVPNRAATDLYAIAGPLKAPEPRVLSCVTGTSGYDPVTARDTLVRWVDHPQRLWDVIDETLRSGVATVVHVGPGPNLIPATFERLGNNVLRQLGHRYLQALGHGVGSRMQRHAWLARLLPSRAALLRAPHVRHVVLEDWLLGHSPP